MGGATLAMPRKPVGALDERLACAATCAHDWGLPGRAGQGTPVWTRPVQRAPIPRATYGTTVTEANSPYWGPRPGATRPPQNG